MDAVSSPGPAYRAGDKAIAKDAGGLKHERYV